MNQSAEHTTTGRLRWRERLFNTTLTGFLAGLWLMLLEAIDRMSVASSSLTSLGQRFVFLSYFSANVVGLTAVGFFAAAAAIALGWLRQRQARWLQPAEQRRWPRVRRWARQGVSLTLLTGVAALAAIALRPWAPAISFLMRKMFIQPLRQLAPDALQWLRTTGSALRPLLLLMMIVIFVGLALAAYRIGRSPRLRQFRLSRRLAWVLSVGLAALTVAAYGLDSRLYVSLYDFTLHLPLFISQLALSLALAAVVTHHLINRRFTAHRRKPLTAGLIVLLGISGLAVFRLGHDQSSKALFWSRSVLARRWVKLLQRGLDFDGDGYAALLGGGDCDDANPAIHPLAMDIPDNGLDENCLGGDLKIADRGPWVAGRGLIDESEAANQELPITSSAAAAGRNILLITIDALRADHLGCYGYSRATSSHLDQLAARSRLFLRAHSQATNTGHSFASMLRSATGVELFQQRQLTFVETLAQNGYQTALFNSMGTQKWLEKERWAIYKEILRRGIQHDGHPGRGRWSAEDVTSQVLQYLKQLQPGGHHFVWAHYLEPHYPYNAHPGFDFGDGEMDRYDSEIAYTDRALAPVLEYVEQNESWRDGLLIVSADHGEAFYEHGQREHSSKPYQEQIHVPLIIRHPKAEAGPVTQPVGLIDLGPTILRFAGLDVPHGYQGWDLFSLPDGAQRLLVSETPRNVPQLNFFIWTLIEGHWKLLYDVMSSSFELYNLQADPGERLNLVDVESEKAADLKAKMGAWIDRQFLHEDEMGRWSVRRIVKRNR